jgi:hypothetical protein
VVKYKEEQEMDNGIQLSAKRLSLEALLELLPLKKHIFQSQDLRHGLVLLYQPLPLQLVELPRLEETKEVTMSQLILKPALKRILLDNQLTMVPASMAALTQHLMHLEVDPNSPTPKLDLVNGGKSK